MQVIQFYFQGVPSSAVEVLECAISDWYCKPAILSCLALKVGCLFVSCSKYGCRQFTPAYSKYFPIHNFDFKAYKAHLPWLVLEFNDKSPNSRWFDDSFCRELFNHQ